MEEIDCSERFWSKVDIATNDDCWEWLAAKAYKYGRFLYKGKNTQAHRVSWILTFGAIPNGKVIMHKCDNPGCVNPDHLMMGTQLDNIQDRVDKGRCFIPSGDKNSQAKLTQSQVNMIRKEYTQTDCTKRHLARKHKISDTTIGRILNGKTWQ